MSLILIKKFKKVIYCKCEFSTCKLYRWSMDLKISNKNKRIIFIGLNPSYSNEISLDNTTKKIIKICEKYNYGKIKLINLFGLITSSPKILINHKDPVGSLNNNIINRYISYWSKTIECDLWIGWGNKGNLFDRDLYVYNILKESFFNKKRKFSNFTKPLFIKNTKHNNPIHPLYCPNNSKLKEFNEFIY